VSSEGVEKRTLERLRALSRYVLTTLGEALELLDRMIPRTGVADDKRADVVEDVRAGVTEDVRAGVTEDVETSPPARGVQSSSCAEW
jgi:hypothetical protein